MELAETAGLTYLQSQIILAAVGNDKTHEKLGEQFGVTRSAVTRTLGRAGKRNPEIRKVIETRKSRLLARDPFPGAGWNLRHNPPQP